MSFEVGEIVTNVNGDQGKVIVAEMDRHGGIVVMNDEGEYDTWYAENVRSNKISDRYILLVETGSMTREWSTRTACIREAETLRQEGKRPIGIIWVKNDGSILELERFA